MFFFLQTYLRTQNSYQLWTQLYLCVCVCVSVCMCVCLCLRVLVFMYMFESLYLHEIIIAHFPPVTSTCIRGTITNKHHRHARQRYYCLQLRILFMAIKNTLQGDKKCFLWKMKNTFQAKNLAKALVRRDSELFPLK